MTEVLERPAVVTLPETLSYSQASTMQKCGWQWVLERGLRVPQRPSWATVGGSGVHYATEVWDNWTLAGEWVNDLDEVTKLFNDQFDKAIGERLEQEPEFTTADWRASGRKSTKWPNKENEDFWRAEGPAMVMRWVTWRSNSPSWEIATVYENGVAKHGIELDFRVKIGGIDVRGYIDRLFHRNETELMVVDIKSGREPDSADQLGTYAIGLEEEYGVTPTWGAYWMARTGGTSEPEDMRLWPKVRLDYLYRVTREQQEAGMFLPKKTSMCSGCSARDYCFAVNGAQSDTVPTPWELVVEKPETSPVDEV